MVSKFKKPQSYRYIARRESWMPPALAKAMAYDPPFNGKEGTEKALLRCEVFKAQATCKAMMIVNHQRNK